ncbi:hypothetical protein [Leucobacter sp.]
MSTDSQQRRANRGIRFFRGVAIACAVLMVAVGLWASAHHETSRTASESSTLSDIASLTDVAPFAVGADIEYAGTDAGHAGDPGGDPLMELCALGVLCGLAICAVRAVRRGPGSASRRGPRTAGRALPQLRSRETAGPRLHVLGVLRI